MPRNVMCKEVSCEFLGNLSIIYTVLFSITFNRFNRLVIEGIVLSVNCCFVLTQNHVLLILKSTQASLSLIKINNTFSFVL